VLAPIADLRSTRYFGRPPSRPKAPCRTVPDSSFLLAAVARRVLAWAAPY